MDLKRKNRLITTGALLILLIAATVIFGAKVLLLALVAIITAVLLELANARIRKEPLDLSSVFITPLIVTLMFTPNIIHHFWIVALSTAFGLFFAKFIFGGQDKNVFNPAAVALIFAALSFPVLVGQFVNPETLAISAVTPATLLKTDPTAFFGQYTLLDLLLGSYAGALGTTFKLGILALGLILIALKVINWRLPLFYLLSYFAIAGILYLIDPSFFRNPIYSLFVGHLLFAAFFMTTDPQTAPLEQKGIIIYAVGLGFVTYIIQRFSSNTEGAIYALVFMNALVGLIDAWTMKKEETSVEEVNYETNI